MPSARSLLLYTASALFISSSIVSAIPIQLQKSFTGATIAPSTFVQDTLAEYYEEIVDQVMEVVSESMYASAPTTLMSARHYQIKDDGKFIEKSTHCIMEFYLGLIFISCCLAENSRVPYIAFTVNAITRKPIVSVASQP